MKCQIPQISWHSRDPVLSIDFQPIDGISYRLASGGTDSHVLIWYVIYQEDKSIKVECASDLYRHNKSVNVVRFSPKGELLASGDDEGAMFVWQLKDQIDSSPKDEENANKEDWYPVKLLRGHLEDIYDISWSSDGNFLVSASMDNTAILWDMQKYQKVHIFSDCKGYVQGVAWDPCNKYIASVGSDRALRIHNVSSKKTVYRVQRAPWMIKTEKGSIRARLFYDDTLKSYFRRLCFTPDGELLIVPSGIVDKGDSCANTTYLFSRHALNKPVMHLPTGDKYTVAVRCNPFLYKLRTAKAETQDKENKPLIELPYRMIFAVAACDSVLVYDTEQLSPFAYVSNIHYTHLTDMTWSPDGLTLVASSTDGYCSFIIFTREELGEIYVPKVECVVLEKMASPESKMKKTDLHDTQEKEPVSEVVSSPIETVCTPVEVPKKCPIPLEKKVVPDDVTSLNVKAAVKISPRSVTPSLTPKSGKKTPKMCSIKSFFMSPRALSEKTVSNDSTLKNKNVEKCVEPNNVKLESACKETQKSSVADNKFLITDKQVTSSNKRIGEKNSGVTASCLNEFEFSKSEKMESDVGNSDSIEVLFESSSSKSVDKQPKCKVQLTFGSAIKPSKPGKAVAIADDPLLVDDDAVSSFKDIKEREDIIEVENDWKLELSQDEEDVCMDITPLKAADPVSKPVAEEKQKSPAKLTPKRRIPLITLSKKIVTCQSKD